MGGGQYVDVARPARADSLGDSRAVGVADLNGDGRSDLVISNNNGAPVFLINKMAGIGPSLSFRLWGTESNRDAIGARVSLTVSGVTMTRHVEAGSGYASQSSATLHFGLGSGPVLERLAIRWPSGLEERFDAGRLMGLALDQTVTITEGEGELRAVRLADATPR